MALQDLHIVAVNGEGTLWHTIRFADGTWQPAFGNVQSQNQGQGQFSDAACATDGANLLHVVGVNANGHLLYTYHNSDGTWQGSFSDISSQESNDSTVNPFHQISCSAVAGVELHMVGVTSNALWGPWHTIRFENGSLQSAFGYAAGTSNPIFNPFLVSCATDGNQNLHVVGASQNANSSVSHTTRYPNGSWQPVADSIPTPNSGKLVPESVSCTVDGQNTLYVLLRDSGSGLYLTTRTSSGGWSRWEHIQDHVSGGPTGFSASSCAIANNGDLHIIGVGPLAWSPTSYLYHTVRPANAPSNWQATWGNVNNMESNGTSVGTFSRIACASFVSF